MLGPYGRFLRVDGPPRLPEEVVRDLVLQAAPTVVVGRYTAAYVHEGILVNEKGLLYYQWHRRHFASSGEIAPAPDFAR